MSGVQGTFVVSWSQTEVDGMQGAPLGALGPGACWRWSGEPVRVDGPGDVLILRGPIDDEELKRRAARAARRILRRTLSLRDASLSGGPDEPVFDRFFEVSDGRTVFAVTLIEMPESARPLLLFIDRIPPRDTDLSVVRCPDEQRLLGPRRPKPPGVICFADGTLLRTPRGEVAVEDLHPGDLVETRDNGAQPVVWSGYRRMTGARLHALPDLRPVRIRAHALGLSCPAPDLVVSPGHRILVRGAAAGALFGEAEVLVAAVDMVNDRSVTIEHGRRDVVYRHVMLPGHQVVWANGVACESFHPGHTDLSSIPEDQRALLFARDPALQADPGCFGAPVRRMLSGPEAAVLLQEARDAARRSGRRLAVAS
ncbi:Hint domain-containing protein [Oceaniglobus roseus]|uniref:Hint domain-containing protein n=1 Tax=Oceaniglobus roseus TaxID=1737570 RepID=UPI000C7F080C|nr:Hint domain-containing protein [Kandeliimicrobium roseum]